MSRACVCCSSPKRDEIDRALLDGVTPEREVARLYRVNRASLQRHRRAHITERKTARAVFKAEVVQATRSLLGDVDEALAIVRRVDASLNAIPEGLTVGLGLESGYYEMQVKVAQTLLQAAKLVHGTKLAVVPVQDDFRATLRALPPAERRARIVEIQHRLLELQAETEGGER
jgi:hypothetical protein